MPPIAIMPYYAGPPIITVAPADDTYSNQNSTPYCAPRGRVIVPTKEQALTAADYMNILNASSSRLNCQSRNGATLTN